MKLYSWILRRDSEDRLNAWIESGSDYTALEVERMNKALDKYKELDQHLSNDHITMLIKMEAKVK